MDFNSLELRKPSFMHFDSNSASESQTNPLHLLEYGTDMRQSSFLGQIVPVPHHSKEFLPNIYPKPILFQFKTIPSCPVTACPCTRFLSPWTVEEAWALVIVLFPHWGQVSSFQVLWSLNSSPKRTVGFCPSACISCSWKCVLVSQKAAH